MIKASKDIIVIVTEINDEVIDRLKQADDHSEDLGAVMEEYAFQLEEQGIEIFYRGNDFVVCEDWIYLACYEEDCKIEE